MKGGVASAGFALAALWALVLAPAPAIAQAASPAALAGATAEARPAEIPTSVFAARSPFSGSPVLSPDGRRVAYSFTEGDRTRIGVIDIDSGTIERTIPLEEDQYLRSFRWAGPDRLLLGVSIPVNTLRLEGRVSRLFVADIATRQTYYVGPRGQGLYGDRVVHVDPAGRTVTLSLQPALDSEPEIWRFALDGTDDKGERLAAKRGIHQWYLDNLGEVRLGLGYENRRYKVWYRSAPQDEFRLVGRIREADREELWKMVSLVAGSDEGLAFEPGPSGRTALRRFNYATRTVGEVVFENPEWDVSGAMTDDDGAPMAVTFTDDRDHIHWLYPEYARLQASLNQALGGGVTRIINMSDDESRLLVWHGEAHEPGTWYVYTKATKGLAEFSRLRPDLDPGQLAVTRPIDFSARDGTRIRAYLTLPRGREAKDLPLIVMPHGGPYGVRDKIEYVDEVQLLANRGYAVLQPNYRGSDGFGEAFEDLGKGQIGRRMQDDLDDAMDWAVAQGIADRDRACLVGASYGGYAAIWGTIRNPERWRCAASFAGVMDWDKQLFYSRDFLYRSDRPAWRERVRGEEDFDLDAVSPARNAAALTRPVLIVQGRKDATVPFTQYLEMQKATEKASNTNAQYMVIEGAGHGFAEPEDQQKWFDALLGFLARNNPAG